MPTEAQAGTNQFRCDACGRRFNTGEELKSHQVECLAAKAAGSGSRQTSQSDREAGEGREWVSTP